MKTKGNFGSYFIVRFNLYNTDFNHTNKITSRNLNFLVNIFEYVTIGSSSEL